MVMVYFQLGSLLVALCLGGLPLPRNDADSGQVSKTGFKVSKPGGERDNLFEMEMAAGMPGINIVQQQNLEI